MLLWEQASQTLSVREVFIVWNELQKKSVFDDDRDILNPTYLSSFIVLLWPEYSTGFAFKIEKSKTMTKETRKMFYYI